MSEKQRKSKLTLYLAAGVAAVLASALAYYITSQGGPLDSIIEERLIESRITMAQVQIARLSQAVEMYQMDNGKYPSTTTGLLALVAEGGVTEEQLTDPWGMRFLYAMMPGGGYELRSAGPNGIPGDEDDVLAP